MKQIFEIESEYGVHADDMELCYANGELIEDVKFKEVQHDIPVQNVNIVLPTDEEIDFFFSHHGAIKGLDFSKYDYQQDVKRIGAKEIIKLIKEKNPASNKEGITPSELRELVIREI